MAKKTNTDPTPSAPLGWIGRIRAPQVPPPWGMGEVFALGVVLVVALFVLASGVATLFSGDMAFLTPSALMIGWGVGLVAVLGYLFLTKRRTPQERDALRLVRAPFPLPIALLIGIGMGLLFDLVAVVTGAGFARVAELRDIPLSGGELIVSAFVVIILQPLAYGVAFCGVILPRLRVSLGSWAGFWTTILAFTLFYYGLYGAQLPPSHQLGYGVLVPFGMMFTASVVRLRAQSTLTGVVTLIGWGIVAVSVALTLS